MDITAAVSGIKCKVNKLTTLKTANVTLPGIGHGKASFSILYSKDRELKSQLCAKHIEMGLRLGNSMPCYPFRAFWKMDPDKQIGVEFRMIVIDSNYQLIGDIFKTLAYSGGMLYFTLHVCTFRLTHVQIFLDLVAYIGFGDLTDYYGAENDLDKLIFTAYDSTERENFGLRKNMSYLAAGFRPLINGVCKSGLPYNSIAAWDIWDMEIEITIDRDAVTGFRKNSDQAPKRADPYWAGGRHRNQVEFTSGTRRSAIERLKNPPKKKDWDSEM